MAELQIHTLEDCGCTKNSKNRCKTCGDKSNNGDPANSGNYNIINIGNDILDSGNNTRINHANTAAAGVAPAPSTHTREIIVQEREIPKIVERNIPVHGTESLMMMAQNELQAAPLPIRAFNNQGYNIALYRAFY